MSEPWLTIELNELLARSYEPIFVMNEQGRIVFANPAMHFRFSVPLGSRVGWQEVESQLLRKPSGLQPGQSQMLELPSTEVHEPMSVVFHSLRDPSNQFLAILGVIVPSSGFDVRLPVSDHQFHLDWNQLRERQWKRWSNTSVPGRSKAGARLLEQLDVASKMDLPVLLFGEPGTGKRTLAYWIQTRRSKGQNILEFDFKLLSDDLEGAVQVFPEGGPEDSGAQVSSPRKLIIARNLSSASREFQRRMLQLLEQTPHRPSVVFTDRNTLEQQMQTGQFSRDLYYLATRMVIPVPALRERREDILLFCSSILSQLAEKESVPTLASDAQEELLRHDWPGNIRELRSVLEFAFRSQTDGVIRRANLPKSLGQEIKHHEIKSQLHLDTVLESVERRLLTWALNRFRGNKSRAADFVGWSRARLIRRLGQLNLDIKRASDEPDPGVEMR
jgi:DNA-binding NtrC family response regulator